MKLMHRMTLHMILLIYIVSSFISQASVIMTKQMLLESLEDLAFENLARSDDTCQTPGCIKTATKIRENMDETINPCDDFYNFACGGFVAKRDIPDDKSVIGVFSDVQDELNSQLKELVSRPLDGSEPKFIKMVKDMYDSCMNLKSREEAKGEPLKKVLNSLGGWPVVQGESWDASKFDWIETVSNLRKHGYRHKTLVAMDVEEDFRNNTVHIITLDQPELGMPDREYLLAGLNDSATEAYFNLMVNAANKLGANEASSRKELMDVLTFEITLANYSLPAEERRNFSALYNKFTIKELKELTPQIDWLKYFNGLLDDLVSDLEKVIVGVPDFIKKFAELVTNTDKRTVANYMMWRVVIDSLPLLSKEWRDLGQDYVKEITGSSKEEPLWEKCLNSLADNLAIAQSAYYVKNYFQAESKEKSDEIVNYLRKEFLVMLENLDWMDESTKTQAKDKANAIISYIGYPQELANDSLVLEYYQNLTITTESYFNNVLNLKKFNIDNNFSKLRKPNIKGEWKKHAEAAVVNAFYNPIENSIDFPAGILQKAFFNKDRPHYMNFGGIGYVIGHEITHGFDDMGRQFDKEGNNKNWWDDTTDAHFKQKAQCIIEQYGNYTAENGMKLNGINTQGENIADNGGMKEAYLAYQAWVKDNGPEPKLPGLNYTPNQLFWISAANVWCVKYKPEVLKLSILSGVHSPSNFRVIGPMSNLVDFSKAFQCPPGSPMNPHDKCKVW